MRTELTITARQAAVPSVHAIGGLAGRITGTDTVHVIGTAATPLGGDHIEIAVAVAAGARLTLRSAAASIALPARATDRSTAHWQIDVGDDGYLDVDLEPIVVAAGADHHAVVEIRIAPTASVRFRERVQIGRAGESHGRWSGELHADTGGFPLLRHRLDLGAGTPADDVIDAPRALISELVFPADRAAATVGLHCATLPLARGGTLSTWTGPALAGAGSG